MLLLVLCATSEDNLDGLPSLILSMALVLWKSLLEILLIRDMDSHPVFFNDHWQFQTLISSSLLFPALPDLLYGSCGHGSQAWGNSPTSQNALLQLGYIHPTFIKPPWLRSPLGYYVMPWTFYTCISIFKLSLLRSPKGYLLHSLKHFMHLHVILWTRLLSSWPSPVGYMTSLALGLWLVPL